MLGSSAKAGGGLFTEKLRKGQPKEANPWVELALVVCSTRFAECFSLPCSCSCWHKGWDSASLPALARVLPGDVVATAASVRHLVTTLSRAFP